MKVLKSVVIPVTITFFLTWILGLILTFFQVDKGKVEVGPTIKIGEQYYVPLNIANYSQKTLNDLIITVPKSLSVNKIICSDPIKVVESATNVETDNRTRINISELMPEHLTQLFLPIDKKDEDKLIKVINAKELNMSSGLMEEIKSPAIIATKKALIDSIIYTILFAIVYSLFVIHWTKIEEAATREHNKLREEIDKVSNEYKKYEKECKECRLLLLARLSDYSKENNFWRDTIRKIMYEWSHDKNLGEQVVNQVTDMLKTYSIRKHSSENFEAAKVLAQMFPSKLKEPNNNLPKDES